MTIAKTQIDIKMFSSLPDEGFISVDTASVLFEISSATLWRWVKDGNFPKPVKLGDNCTRWNVGTLRKYVQDLLSDVEKLKKQIGENVTPN
jgi:prophage regulatory protein